MQAYLAVPQRIFSQQGWNGKTNVLRKSLFKGGKPTFLLVSKVYVYMLVDTEKALDTNGTPLQEVCDG